VVNEILPAVKKGRKVFTNIDGLNMREIGLYLGIPETSVDITVIDEHKEWREKLVLSKEDKEGKNFAFPLGSLIILDEAQEIYNSRDFKSTRGFFTFSWHRHLGLDLVFISQSVKRMEVNIGRMANESYQVKNLGMIAGALKRRYIVNRRQTPFDTDVLGQLKVAILRYLSCKICFCAFYRS
jgi:zona occludens toxin